MYRQPCSFDRAERLCKMEKATTHAVAFLFLFRVNPCKSVAKKL